MQAIQVASHLRILSESELQKLFKKTFTQEQLIQALSQRLTLDDVSQIPPCMKFIKDRVYRRLGMYTTKEVKEFAIAESIVAPSADFRKKETWLKVQRWIDNPEVCLLPKAEETEVEAIETVVEPVSETEVLKASIQTMNVRKLRETAKAIKLPQWGNIVNKQGAEALRSALLQFLG